MVCTSFDLSVQYMAVVSVFFGALQDVVWQPWLCTPQPMESNRKILVLQISNVKTEKGDLYIPHIEEFMAWP